MGVRCVKGETHLRRAGRRILHQACSGAHHALSPMSRCWSAHLPTLTGPPPFWSYCTGLLLPGTRKSVEPMAARVGHPQQEQAFRRRRPGNTVDNSANRTTAKWPLLSVGPTTPACQLPIVSIFPSLHLGRGPGPAYRRQRALRHHALDQAENRTRSEQGCRGRRRPASPGARRRRLRHRRRGSGLQSVSTLRQVRLTRSLPTALRNRARTARLSRPVLVGAR